jgi:hypothetical protein
MILDEQLDPDEILRDVSDYQEDDTPEDMRELNFGTFHDENANFSDFACGLDNTEDLFE